MALQKCHKPIFFVTGLCMAKILHKYLDGSAKVPQANFFVTRLCMAKILRKYLYGAAKVPMQSIFTRVDREPLKPNAQQSPVFSVGVELSAVRYLGFSCGTCSLLRNYTGKQNPREIFPAHFWSLVDFGKKR